MPHLTPYHLTFPRGLHVGRGGVESVEDSLEYIPSDTLFAALLDTWRHLGREVSGLLPENGEPALRVTSAFPFAGGVRFYPKPVDLYALLSPGRIAGLGAGKNIKKIRYLSEALLRRASGGAFLDDELAQDSDGEWACKTSLQGGALWLTEAETKALPGGMKDLPGNALPLQKIYVSQTAPRVTVDRVSSASNLFQSERVLFNEGCGLWFGAAGQIDNLPYILSALGESGLGGERTTGYGGFTFHNQDKPLDLPDPQGRACLLSRWHPAPEETALLQDEDSAYRLEAVGGWLRTPDPAAAQRRKRVWMVAEGSLIAGNPQGDAPNVKPAYNADTGETIPHPVYRPGFAVAIDWKR